MGFVINICKCGKAFEAKSILRVYCDDCRKERTKEANKRARKKYLATEHGKEKHNAHCRATYYRHLDERRERVRKYYHEHKEERAEYVKRKRAEEPKLCIRCKEPFDRQGSERICPICREKIERQREMKRIENLQEQEARKQKTTQKNETQQNKKKIGRRLKCYHEQIKRLDEKFTQTPQVVLTEEEKLARFRAALAKYRAAKACVRAS